MAKNLTSTLLSLLKKKKRKSALATIVMIQWNECETLDIILT